MRCPSCSADNAATRRFCAKCRAPLPSPCLACGFENELGAQFCGGCGKPVGEAAAPTRPAAPLRPRTDDAERRQLTVMFCDLVGSTVPSARLDPEDLRAVIGTYHRCCAGVIERGGGFVAKYMRDGVLAYFGHSRADENDAKRAVWGSPWSTQRPGSTPRLGCRRRCGSGLTPGWWWSGICPRQATAGSRGSRG